MKKVFKYIIAVLLGVIVTCLSNKVSPLEIWDFSFSLIVHCTVFILLNFFIDILCLNKEEE